MTKMGGNLTLIVLGDVLWMPGATSNSESVFWQPLVIIGCTGQHWLIEPPGNHARMTTTACSILPHLHCQESTLDQCRSEAVLGPTGQLFFLLFDKQPHLRWEKTSATTENISMIIMMQSKTLTRFEPGW